MSFLGVLCRTSTDISRSLSRTAACLLKQLISTVYEPKQSYQIILYDEGLQGNQHPSDDQSKPFRFKMNGLLNSFLKV